MCFVYSIAAALSGGSYVAIEVRDICALLSVYDMPEAVRFYTKLLGFEVVSRAPTYEVIDGVEHFHWCMLKNGETALMLNTEYDTGERPPTRPALAEQRLGVWFYLGCPDVDGAFEQLRAAGIQCDPPTVVKYGFRTVSFRDPDGHGITLQWPV
jgi:glyoxylase I family protein